MSEGKGRAIGRPGGLRPLLAALVALPLAAIAGTGEPQAQVASDVVALPIEQLLNLEVSTASRFAQKLSEAPSAITIITAADIRAFGWRTLADVLRSVRGLHVENDRNYEYLGARGYLRPGDYNSRFLLMIDGVRINDAVYDNAPIGNDFPLDLDLVERIEYVAGPGSSVYGTNAVFGVINVIPKRGRDFAGGQGALALGTQNAFESRATWGWRGADLELLLSATSYSTRGRDLHFAEFEDGRANGVAHDLDYERGKRFFLRAGHGGLQLTLAHGERIKGVPTASYEQLFNDPRSRTRDVSTLLDLSWRHAVSPSFEWSSHLSLGNVHYEGRYPYEDGLVTDGSRARQWRAELKAVGTAWAGHKVVAGLDLQRDTRRDQYYSQERLLMAAPAWGTPAAAAPTATTVPYTFNDHRSNQRAAVYLQDEMALGERLLLNLGLRHEHNRAGDGNTSPRAGAIWKAAPGTAIKALYGSAFREPNAYEQYYMIAGEGAQEAAPHLKAERLRTSELVIEQEFGPTARLNLSLFRTRVTGLIEQVMTESGSLQYRNVARADAHGAEIEYQRIWDNGMRLRASWTRQRVTDTASGEWLVKSPRHLGKFNLSTPLWSDAVRAGIESFYVGPRRSLRGEAAPYWLTNLQLSTLRLGPGVEASLTIHNLFDRRYADPGSVEHVQDLLVQDGRSLRAKVVVSF